MPDDEEESGGLGFTLPPFSLPRLVPPAVSLPVPGRYRVAGSHVLAAAVAVDAVDAAIGLLVAPAPVPVVRGVMVALVAVALTGRLGALAAWEPLAAALGAGPVTAIPTATVLVLARARTGGQDRQRPPP